MYQVSRAQKLVQFKSMKSPILPIHSPLPGIMILWNIYYFVSFIEK